MDIKVYTDTLESHLIQLLHILYPTARCTGKIGCIIICRPNDEQRMWVEWTLHGMLPREGAPTYAWATELHKGLRKFPCLGNLTIKYSNPRANWNATDYYYGNHWNTGFSRTWDHIEANEGGMDVFGQAHIPMPAEASETVTVRLEWDFKVPNGL